MYKILVIDSNTDHVAAIQWAVELAMKGKGNARVEFANNSDKAQALLGQEKFHLVFWEHELKGSSMTGSQLMADMRRNHDMYDAPVAIWVHTDNTYAAQLMKRQLETDHKNIISHITPFSQCAKKVHEFAETIADILNALDKKLVDRDVIPPVYTSTDFLH